MAFRQVSVSPSEIFNIYRQPGVDLGKGISTASEELGTGVTNYIKKKDQLAKEADAVNLLHDVKNVGFDNILGAIKNGKNADLAVNLYQLGISKSAAERQNKLADIQLRRAAAEDEVIGKHGWDLLEFGAKAGGPIQITPDQEIVKLVPDEEANKKLDDQNEFERAIRESGRVVNDNDQIIDSNAIFDEPTPKANLFKEVRTTVPGKSVDVAKDLADYRKAHPELANLDKTSFIQILDTIEKAKISAGQSARNYIDNETRKENAAQREQNALLIQRLRNEGSLETQGLRNQGALDAQDLRNTGAMDRLKATNTAADERLDKQLKGAKSIAEMKDATARWAKDAELNLRKEIGGAKTKVAADKLMSSTFDGIYKRIQKDVSEKVIQGLVPGTTSTAPGMLDGAAYWKNLGNFSSDMVKQYALKMKDEAGFYTFLIRQYMTTDSGGIVPGVDDAAINAITDIKKLDASTVEDPELKAFLSSIGGKVNHDRFKKFLNEAKSWADRTR